MKLNDIINKTVAKLAPHYGDGEAKWLTRTIIEHIKGWNQVDILMNGDKELSEFIIGKIDDVVTRLLNDEPVQYIFGNTYWYGMTLKVSPDVLIPRPETSELVDMIVKDNNASDLKVIDVCTGSGCIAVALARNLPFASVTGIDISSKALAIAKENAEIQKAKIKLLQQDILDETYSLPSGLDIIVSNPPYIAENEKKSMDANVIDHEPSIALFVPDDDPLKFYKRISDLSMASLNDNGKLYYEINPFYATDLTEMMSHQGWTDIQLFKDIHGKNRFLRAIK